MIWRHGLPTEPGWYWFRSMSKYDYEPRIVQVRDYAGRLAIGNAVLDGWKRMEEGWWAGPIEPPIEPIIQVVPYQE